MKIIYKENKPFGIRDAGGFLLFFPKIYKYTGQEERYRSDVLKQYELSDFLLEKLKNRGENENILAGKRRM